MNDLPNCLLLAESVPNWRLFLQAAKDGLDRSVTRSLDAHDRRPEGLPAYITALDEMIGGQSHPVKSLRKAGALLEHAWVSFLVAADQAVIYKLLQETGLCVNAVDTIYVCQLAVVSGSIATWKVAIENLTTGRESRDVRYLLDKILLILEAKGLGQIWAGYRKESMGDSTFKLLPKGD